jgi:hypothetical protein
MIQSKSLLVRYNYPPDNYLQMLEQKEKEIEGAFKAGTHCDYTIHFDDLGWWTLTLKLSV